MRAFFVERYAASVASVDEWEATGKQVLSAWDHGTFSVEALFQAHNGDHRIAATRLWEIFWYTVNGAWDPKLVMVAKALVFALAATLFIHLLVGALPRRRLLAGGLFAALFAFPLGYQNLVWAFQSQFDFFLLMVAGGWVALVSGRPVLALVIAMLSPFTLGAGPVLAVSYVAHAVAKRINGAWTTARSVVFGGMALVIAGVGASLRGELAAPLGGVADQAFTLLKSLSWPYSNLVLLVSQLPESSRLIPAKIVNLPSAEHSVLLAVARQFQQYPALLVTALGLLAAVMLAPWVILLVRVVRARRVPAVAWGPLCLGVFACGMQAASAIARSNEPLVPTRYIDVVMLMGFASGAALLVLAMEAKRWRRFAWIWVGFVAPGYVVTMGASFMQLRKGTMQEWVVAVRAYFPSHDRTLLPENTHWQLPILERDPSAFATLLDDPDMVLPLSIIDPAHDPRPVARAAFFVARWGLLLAFGAFLFALRLTLDSRHALSAEPPLPGAREYSSR